MWGECQFVCGAKDAENVGTREYVNCWSSLPYLGLKSRSHDETHDRQQRCPAVACLSRRWRSQNRTRTRPSTTYLNGNLHAHVSEPEQLLSAASPTFSRT